MKPAVLALVLAAAACGPNTVVLQGSESRSVLDAPRPASLSVTGPGAASVPADLMLADGSRFGGTLQGSGPGEWQGVLGDPAALHFQCLLRVTDPSRGLNGGVVGACDGPGTQQVQFVY